MKNITALFLAICFIGCNAPENEKIEQKTPIEVEKTKIVNTTGFVFSESDLPECNIDTLGYMFYVQELNLFFACTENDYIELNIKGEDGADGTNGVDGTNGNNGTDGQDGVDGINGQDGADGVDGRIMVRDSNDMFLGRALLIAYNGAYLLSNTGYFFHLNWDGQIRHDTVLFSEADCIGTVYAPSAPTMPTYSKTVHRYLDSLYVPKTYDVNNVASYGPTQYFSMFTNGNCINTSATSDLVELIVIDQIDTGIPTNIIPPLNFN